MPQPAHPDREVAYRPVEGVDVLPLLGLALAAIALASKPIMQLLPWELRVYPANVLLPLLLSGVASALGFLLSWLGYRRLPDSSFARAGLVANGTILGIILLVGLALLWVFRRPLL